MCVVSPLKFRKLLLGKRVSMAYDFFLTAYETVMPRWTKSQSGSSQIELGFLFSVRRRHSSPSALNFRYLAAYMAPIFAHGMGFLVRAAAPTGSVALLGLNR